MIQNMHYDYPGDPELGDAIATEAGKDGLQVLAHKVETLPLEYGTIVPMHYMNEGACAPLTRAVSDVAVVAMSLNGRAPKNPGLTRRTST